MDEPTTEEKLLSLLNTINKKLEEEEKEDIVKKNFYKRNEKEHRDILKTIKLINDKVDSHRLFHSFLEKTTITVLCFLGSVLLFFRENILKHFGF